jgi:hypothetical protein
MHPKATHSVGQTSLTASLVSVRREKRRASTRKPAPRDVNTSLSTKKQLSQAEIRRKMRGNRRKVGHCLFISARQPIFLLSHLDIVLVLRLVLFSQYGWADILYPTLRANNADQIGAAQREPMGLAEIVELSQMLAWHIPILSDFTVLAKGR